MINKLDDILNFINDKYYKKIFLLCGKDSFFSSGANLLIDRIKKDKKIHIFRKISFLPQFEELKKIVQELRDFKPNLILAIGGGTVIDYAKIANIVDLKPNLLNLLSTSKYPFKDKFSKLAVIPTTAGSGAEATSNAVIYINGVKHSLETELLIPDNFFLIPEFLISAPFKIKASSGFDALAQALESLISKKSNSQSVEFALKSLNISKNNLIYFIKTPNIQNATEMSLASNYAGKAINISKTTAPHATSYPFSSYFGISHGHAVSLFFEKFFKFNYDNCNKSETDFDLKKRFDLIFKVFNVRNINEFISKISEIKKDINLECDLIKLNINLEKNFDRISKGINFLRLVNNPIQINENDIYNIMTKKF